MFSSQKFSLVLGLSLLVLSVVSTNKSNAQTAEVVTLEATTQKASGSSGGENIVRAAAINSLNANSLLNSSLNSNSAHSNKNSSTTGGKSSSQVNTEKSATEAQPSGGAALTDGTINNKSATSNLNQTDGTSNRNQNPATDELSEVVKTADDLLNYPPKIQLPSPGGILPNIPKHQQEPLPPGSDFTPISQPTSIPEPSMSLLGGLGVVTAGLLLRRSKSKQG